MRIDIKIMVAISLASSLSGCVDQDPFGLSCRRIVGNYCLRQWEDFETYYVDTLDNKGRLRIGVTGVPVKAISWNARYIIVLQQSDVPSDGNGYMSIDVHNGKLKGPLASVSALGIEGMTGTSLISSKVAWDRLDR